LDCRVCSIFVLPYTQQNNWLTYVTIVRLARQNVNFSGSLSLPSFCLFRAEVTWLFERIIH